MDQLIQFAQQAWQAIQSLAGMALPMKAATIITLLISLWKLSFLQPLWAKLGKLQVYVAPVLGLAVALLQIHPFNFAAVMQQAMMVGALSIALHQVLDGVKTTAGASWLVNLAQFLEGLLPASVAQARMRFLPMTKRPIAGKMKRGK